VKQHIIACIVACVQSASFPLASAYALRRIGHIIQISNTQMTRNSFDNYGMKIHKVEHNFAKLLSKRSVQFFTAHSALSMSNSRRESCLWL